MMFYKHILIFLKKLISLKNINSKDFAKLHPGGQIGKSLTMTLGELINKTEKPIVNQNDKIKTVINEISSKRLGATVVLDGNNISGLITDGDLRRMLEKGADINNLTASLVVVPMTGSPPIPIAVEIPRPALTT